MKKLIHLCVLGGAAAVCMAACSDSSDANSAANSSANGGPDEVEPAVSQAGLTVSGWSKLDAALRTRTLSGTALARPVAEGVSIFVQSKDPEATRRLIEGAGGSVGTVAGDVMTAQVPSEAVAAIANTATVSRLESGMPLRRKLDKAVAAVRADRVHAGASPLPGAFKGAGVVVGVIDNGLDVRHAAFKKADGKSRVRAVWNQSGQGAAPPGFTFGTECTAEQLDAGTCTYQSRVAHGTHVTGIAAGGPVSGVSYVGVAPEADIVFVDIGTAPGSQDREEALSTSMCDAASYIFKKAEALNEPAVINVSMGEHQGPHDGSSLADRCLDNLSGPGKIIVAAAGNEGEGSVNPLGRTPVVLHASATASSTPIVLKFLPGRVRDPRDQKIYAEQIANIWSDANVQLSVRIGFQPLGGGAPVFSSAVTLDKQLPATLISDGTNALGQIGGAGTVSAAGAHNIMFAVTDTDGDAKEGQVTWLFEVTGNGRFDAFIDPTRTGGFIASGQASNVTVDSNMTIGTPAIAAKTLAVGSYVSRNSWTTSDGLQHQQKGRDQELVSVGELSTFSSHGPSRNRASAIKPDITAPGELLISALNSASTEPAERIIRAGTDGFVALEGTSMASPMAAGVVALLLQRDSKLTVDDVRGILDRTAVKPAGVTLPSTEWGRGKIDALAALSDSRFTPPPAAQDEARKSGCSVTPEGTLLSGVCAVALGVSLLVLRRRRREPS